MAPQVHSFDPPERFVAGTVGQPGERTFFLQARSGARVTSVALEKQQAAILGERLDELLDELLASGTPNETIPAVTPHELTDNDPLEQPIVEEFRAGTITLSWDTSDERVVVEVFPFSEANVDPGDGPPVEEPEPEEVLLVRMTSAQARAFCSRTASLVASGRPNCEFCGGPIDADGHLCPRANGFRRSAS